MDGTRLPWDQVFIPLWIINGCSVVANLSQREWVEVIRDVAISLPFVSMLQQKFVGTTIKTWWGVMAPVFVADGFFCIYNATRPNPRASRILIFFGSLIILIPLVVFQYTACEKLEWEENDPVAKKLFFVKWRWVQIFSPVYAVEGLMLFPICCTILCTMGVNARRRAKAAARQAEYDRIAAEEDINVSDTTLLSPHGLVEDGLKRAKEKVHDSAAGAAHKAEKAVAKKAGHLAKEHGATIVKTVVKHSL